MKAPVKYVVVVAGFVAASIAFGSGAVPNAHADTKGPVAVTGTVSLTPGTAVLVDPSQTVALSATDTGTVSTKTALVVQNANDAQRPFVERINLDTNGSSAGSATTAEVVPAGKRAVVEHIHGYCVVTTGSQIFALNVSAPSFDWTGQTANNIQSLTHVSVANNMGGSDHHEFEVSTRLYVEAGQALSANVGLDTGSGLCLMWVTGYLVDAP